MSPAGAFYHRTSGVFCCQDMAMAATGKVAVYIEHGRDLAALKKVIKLLMAYNQQVDQINFLINSTVYLDHVYERLHDWIEVCRQFA